MSNESAPKSFVKLAVGTTSFSSTPNLSTIIAFTLEEISDITFDLLLCTKIRNNIELRKSEILDNIETAEKQKTEAENTLKNYDELIRKSKNEAKNYFNDARKKIIEDIEKKKQALDKEINIEIKKAEAEVAELVSKAPEKIQKIAIETSSDLIRQLIGEEVNNSSISAIVDDLYKKNKGKYYGN